MFDGIGADLIWDGTDEVRIPEKMGAPREGQMEGTVAERITELAGRVCYDDRTEVLSENGWVLFKDLPRSVPVATVNLLTQELEYQTPTDYIADPFDGELYAADSTKVSVRVTYNHNMVVVDKDKLVLRQAVECSGTKYKVRRSALRPNSRVVPPEIVIQPRRYTQPNPNPHSDGVVEREAPGLTIKVNKDWARVLGYYISEGSLNVQEKSGDTVSVYQNSGGMGPIVEAIKGCGFEPTGPYDDPRKDVQQVRIGSSALVRHLIQFGKGSKAKRLPHYVFEWPVYLRETLLDALMYGDGTTSEHGVRIYNTASEGLADDVQRLIVELGRNANINLSQCETCTMYRVRETKHGDHTLNKHKQQDRSEPYSGTVYCVSVPNRTLVVRRNKKVYVSGNCYDSLGSKRSRDSADYFDHILGVGHLSIAEHYNATVEIDGSVELLSTVAIVALNRPWFWVTPTGPDSVRITANCRAVMEWNSWTRVLNEHMPSYPVEAAAHVGTLLREQFSHLAPRLIKGPHIAELSMAKQHLEIRNAAVVAPQTDAEKWITLFTYGSRGFSHELVRHGDFTAMSQRSTRYCNEGKSPWVMHPIIQQYVEGVDDVEGLICREELKGFIAQTQDLYKTWVKRLIPYISKRIDPADPYAKTTARKQARGAARGLLGNALGTELVFSGSVLQWRHIFQMRASAAADGEIRVAACQALAACKESQYGDSFTDLQLVESDDGTGLMLAGGGAS